MARHPTAARGRRPEAADDAFIARLVHLTEWARRNARIVIITAVVVAVVAISGVYYLNRQARLDELAVTQLLEIRQTAASGNSALAIRDLQTFLDRFGGTQAAGEAGILLAQLQLQQGQPTAAIEVLEDFDAGGDALLAATARLLRAAAYEQSGNLDRAEELYRAVGDDAEYEYQRREGLAAAARLSLARGDAAGAAQLYQRLIEMTEADNPQRDVYEMRLGEADAAAASGAAAAPASVGDDSAESTGD
ncbi:MAG: tetratricopeptide repeat protein [Longimicrobiales bacterium]